MSKANVQNLGAIVEKHQDDIVKEWFDRLKESLIRTDLAFENDLRTYCKQFLHSVAQAMKSGQLDNIEGRQWEEVRMLLTEVSQSRAKQGSSTTETAIKSSSASSKNCSNFRPL
jgi:rsbT co-antagonist protein RsbR